VAYYDSSKDGSWVGFNKHWLAFISGEASPLSKQFDAGGIDTLPRNMDDTIIPISAQYSDGADVIYYGEHAHNDFAVLDEVAKFIADQILRYVFGGYIECSVFARGGVFEHKAGWLPTTNRWEEVVGEVLTDTGRISHVNDSYIKWRVWEDVVGEDITDSNRSNYHVSLVNSFPFLTGISESHWLSADNPKDCRLYIRTRAAPRCSVQIDWSINGQGLLPTGVKRDRYEIEIITGTPSTAIEDVSWVTNDPRGLRLRISSKAEGPFRWFKAEWRAYQKETRVRKVIDEIPAQALLGTTPSSQ
jgi:hypothetical protein